MTATIAVLTEEYFSPAEYRGMQAFFPAHGYRVELLSHLWGQASLTFGSYPEDGVVTERVTVTGEVATANPADFAGVILSSGYACDRLRYQAKVAPGQVNRAPAVEFLRRAVAAGVPIGAQCHSLWLACAAPETIRGRRVTCTHNVITEVAASGAVIVYEGDGTADVVTDAAPAGAAAATWVTAKHPGCLDRFLAAYLTVLAH